MLRTTVPRRPLLMECVTLRCLALTLYAVVGLVAPTTGQPRDRGQGASTASLAGRITTGTPARPLAGAQVNVSAERGRTQESTTTGPDGRFLVDGLPAGRYVVTAGKGGFLRLQFGQTRPFDRGTPLQLAAGESLTGVDVHLPRGAVLTGLVLDQLGEPAVGAMAHAQRYEFASGRWRMVTAGRSDDTDDRGRYRIYGLPPGEYFLEVVPNGYSSSGAGPTYYPGTTEVDSAQRIAVGLGEELAGLDLQLTHVETGRVTGRVAGAGGLPPTVGLVSRTPGARIRSGRVGRDGSFAIDGVPPGRYLAYTSTSSTDGPIRFALAELTVGAGDAEGLALQLTTGARAAGMIAVYGGDAVPFTPPELQLFTMPQGFVDVPVGRGTGRVANDWSFEIQGIGDAQLIRLIGLPDGWELEAVLLNGQDITDQPVRLPAGRTTDGFRIVVTDRTTRLLATVVDDAGRPVAGAQVLIFPTDETRWTYPSRFVRHAQADHLGTIDVRGLPSERYLVFAAEGIPSGAETDPDLLQRLRPLAGSLTLGAGETRQVPITLAELP